MAGCARASPARTTLPRLRYARHTQLHHADRLRLFVVYPDATDHRKRVRPVGLRAEPGPYRKELGRRADTSDPGRPSTAARLHGERRGFYRRARAAYACQTHERT